MKKRLLALLLCLTMLAGNLAIAESVEQPEVTEVTESEETVIAVEAEEPAADVVEEKAEEPAEEKAVPEANEQAEETMPEADEEAAPEEAEEVTEEAAPEVSEEVEETEDTVGETAEEASEDVTEASADAEAADEEAVEADEVETEDEYLIATIESAHVVINIVDPHDGYQQASSLDDEIIKLYVNTTKPLARSDSDKKNITVHLTNCCGDEIRIPFSVFGEPVVTKDEGVVYYQYYAEMVWAKAVSEYGLVPTYGYQEITARLYDDVAGTRSVDHDTASSNCYYDPDPVVLDVVPDGWNVTVDPSFVDGKNVTIQFVVSQYNAGEDQWV